MMEIVKIFLLIVAYSLGIATIFLQILCYLKKIELKETILFSVSLLALVLWATISEILTSMQHKEVSNNVIFSFLILIVAFTTPLNIHAERIVKKHKLKTRIVGTMASGLILLTISAHFFNFFSPVYIANIVFLNLSIFYSMMVIVTSKPKFLIKHRDKTEKRTAVFILLLMTLFMVTGILLYGKLFIDEMMLNGSVILAIICIVLCAFKITDDIQRLSLISNATKFSWDNLTDYNITPREREVIILLVKGLSYKAIADKLFISIPTVKSHATNIYQKLDVSNKMELVNLLKKQSVF